MYDTTYTSPYTYIRTCHQHHIAIHVLYSKYKQNILNEENMSAHFYNPKTQQQKITIILSLSPNGLEMCEVND